MKLDLAFTLALGAFVVLGLIAVVAGWPVPVGVIFTVSGSAAVWALLRRL